MDVKIQFLIILVTTVLYAQTSYSDLMVVLAKESDLPFELSPSNFDNSPRNFDNSRSNFDNSSSNFDNSPSNFDNSPSNLKNGISGNRRLLFRFQDKHLVFGYYTTNSDGLINFYSTQGTRLFYSPPETQALFDGTSGEFCGAFASQNGNPVVAITEKGKLALAVDGITLPGEDVAKPQSNPGGYLGTGGGHWINAVVDSGSVIVLEDGSIWKVDPLDTIYSVIWLPISSITVVRSAAGTPGYDYTLVNTDDDEKVHAKYIGTK